MIVHRTLDACLKEEVCPYKTEVVASVAKQCNTRKDDSKNAQDASQKLYLVAYLSGLHDPIIEDAIVYDIGSRSFDVLVPKYGIEKRVWVEDAIQENLVAGCRFSPTENTLSLYWFKREGHVSSDVKETQEGVAELAAWSISNAPKKDKRDMIM